MESYIKTSNNKRFVVENSITKVTSDGEPHETMTMIAGFSGLVVAVFILVILATLIGCNKKRRVKHCKTCSLKSSHESIEKLSCSTTYFRNLSNSSSSSNESPRSSISTNYTRTTSSVEITDDVKQQSRTNSIATIYNGNFNTNLNAAFVGSELTLSDSLNKKKKKNTHWSDDISYCDGVKETKIDIERY